ncbi:hypothetical protein, partial [Paracraurococcus ruber]
TSQTSGSSPSATPPVAAGSYVLAHRRADRARPALRAFADWLAAEMRADLPRLAALSRAALAGAATGGSPWVA